MLQNILNIERVDLCAAEGKFLPFCSKQRADRINLSYSTYLPFILTTTTTTTTTTTIQRSEEPTTHSSTTEDPTKARRQLPTIY